jgi:undecaprenyl pyrophosphate phosphatase UppP
VLAAIIWGLQGLTGFLAISSSGHLVLVAAVCGFLAITFLFSTLRRTELVRYATYCFIVGGLTVAFLG